MRAWLVCVVLAGCSGSTSGSEPPQFARAQVGVLCAEYRSTDLWVGVDVTNATTSAVDVRLQGRVGRTGSIFGSPDGEQRVQAGETVHLAGRHSDGSEICVWVVEQKPQAEWVEISRQPSQCTEAVDLPRCVRDGGI